MTLPGWLNEPFKVFGVTNPAIGPLTTASGDTSWAEQVIADARLEYRIVSTNLEGTDVQVLFDNIPTIPEFCPKCGAYWKCGCT